MSERQYHEIVRCNVARDIEAEVILRGKNPTSEALDKLIEILVMARNNWREDERDRMLRKVATDAN